MIWSGDVDAQLSPEFCAGRDVFLYRGLAGAQTGLAGVGDRLAAQIGTPGKGLYPFEINAWVVLPDHLHCIWTLPEGDGDFATRWRLIKLLFARGLPKDERRSAVRRKRGERGIWHRHYWEHTIRDDRDYCAHVDCSLFNPVKHGWVSRVKNWPLSTFHHYMKSGLLPEDWAGGDKATADVTER